MIPVCLDAFRRFFERDEGSFMYAWTIFDDFLNDRMINVVLVPFFGNA